MDHTHNRIGPEKRTGRRTDNCEGKENAGDGEILEEGHDKGVVGRGQHPEENHEYRIAEAGEESCQYPPCSSVSFNKKREKISWRDIKHDPQAERGRCNSTKDTYGQPLLQKEGSEKGHEHRRGIMGQDCIRHCGVLIGIEEGEGVGEANGSDNEKVGEPSSPWYLSPVPFL